MSDAARLGVEEPWLARLRDDLRSLAARAQHGDELAGLIELAAAPLDLDARRPPRPPARKYVEIVGERIVASAAAASPRVAPSRRGRRVQIRAGRR